MSSSLAPATQGSTWRGSSLYTQIMVLTGRSLRSVLLDPKNLLFTLLTPLMMLLLFSQVFSNVANTPGFPKGVSYINFLMPATLVTTALSAAMTAGVGFVNDLRNGVLARFRALPINGGSILAARSLADLVRSAVQLIIMIIAAVALFGFTPKGFGVAGALLLALVVGWGLGWLFLAVATWMRNPETLQMFTFLAMFPLMFGSSAYMPLEGLPGWMQFVATINPLTYAIDASRELTLQGTLSSTAFTSIGISLVIAAGGMVFAAKGFRRQ